MSSFLPEGLSSEVFKCLKECAELADNRMIEDLTIEARQHVELARKANEINAIVNYNLASAIFNVIQKLSNCWSDIPEHEKHWLKGAICYFSSSDDDENDFTSPMGFEDDVDVLNACLKLASMDDLVIDPEDFDEV